MAYIMIIASIVAGVGIFVFERIVPFEHVPQQTITSPTYELYSLWPIIVMMVLTIAVLVAGLLRFQQSQYSD